MAVTRPDFIPGDRPGRRSSRIPGSAADRKEGHRGRDPHATGSNRLGEQSSGQNPESPGSIGQYSDSRTTSISSSQCGHFTSTSPVVRRSSSLAQISTFGVNAGRKLTPWYRGVPGHGVIFHAAPTIRRGSQSGTHRSHQRRRGSRPTPWSSRTRRATRSMLGAFRRLVVIPSA